MRTDDFHYLPDARSHILAFARAEFSRQPRTAFEVPSLVQTSMHLQERVHVFRLSYNQRPRTSISHRTIFELPIFEEEMLQG